MALILLASSRSSLPGDAAPEDWLIQYRSEAGHLGEYAVLSLLAYAYLRSHATKRRAALLSLALCIAFSLGDELFQSFIPNRAAELKDILLDAAGAAGALSLAAMVVPRLRRYWSDDGRSQEPRRTPRSSAWRNSQK
ncbi:MAG: VanZ family protein [Chloroflexi bacterium]|nr:VanZ family protein [Chloroflexota bacterium]